MLGRRDGTTAGVATFDDNWISTGMTLTPEQTPYNNVVAQISGYTDSIFGTNPGLLNAAAADYRPGPSSPVVDAGGQLPITLDFQYVIHQGGSIRSDSAAPSLGAFEVAQP